MAAAFDGVMKAIFERQVDQAEAVRQQELRLENLQGEIAKSEQRLTKAEGAEHTDKDWLKRMRAWLDDARRSETNVKATIAELRKEPRRLGGYGKVASSYFKEASKLAGSGDYWTRPTELFARAFEAYVFDRIGEQGQVSQYLVQGVEPERYGSSTYKGNPYPVGLERDAINAAFDKLFAAMQTRETGKGTALYSRSSQTDTPAFKRWFGDWGALQKKHALDAMLPVSVDSSALGTPAQAGFEARAKHAYTVLKEATNVIDNKRIQFVMTGYRKLVSHSADSRTLRIIPGLKALVEDAIPIYTEPHTATRPNENTRAWHTYAARAELDGEPVYVKLVVREDAAGRRTLDFFHDATVTPSKEIRQALPSTTRLSMAEGAVQVLAAKDKLYQWYHEVNADTVSKVVDEKGEPLLVYHGTDQKLTEFRDKHSTDGFYFTSNKSLAKDYAKEAEEHALLAGTKARVLSTYLSLKNPLVVDDSDSSLAVGYGHDELIKQAKRDGHDGVIIRNTRDNIIVGSSEDLSDTYVAFRPEQIKSATGNVGTFDPANPDIRYSYLGREAALADHSALGEAIALSRQGVEMEDIREKTGWFRAKDKHWRFELSDKDSRLWAGWREARTVGQAFRHDKLFKNYPALGDLKFSIEALPYGVNGAFDPKRKTIVLNADLDAKAARSVLLHELQHVVQNIERFTPGGSPSSKAVQELAWKRWSAEERRLHDRLNKFIDLQNAWMEETGRGPHEYRELFPSYGKEIKDLNKQIAELDHNRIAHQTYRRLLGEVEARDVQVRADMGDMERGLIEPYVAGDPGGRLHRQPEGAGDRDGRGGPPPNLPR